MPKALFLYRNHDNDDSDDDDDGGNYSHHPSSQNRRRVDDMSYTYTGSSKSGSGNKQFNGYQTIMNSEIRQYGGQYLLQSSNHSNHSSSSSSGGSKGGSGMKARRGNASLVVSEDLVRSNQIKRRIRWV